MSNTTTSSRRTPGPIRRVVSIQEYRWTLDCSDERHGLWIPAFAGTTLKLWWRLANEGNT